MSFIAKNPLNIPKIETNPPAPMPGTRGLFAKEDGWYDINSDGAIQKIPLAISDWNQSDSTKEDYIKNKPVYLNEFFKPFPQDLSIDELTEPGTYIGYENANYNSYKYTMPFILFVSNHNSLDEFDSAKTCQMRIYCNPLSEIGDNIMESRLYENNGWTAWETIYATQNDIETEIKKLDYLTSFFKTMPDGRNLDTLRPFNDTENINGTYLIDENTVVVVNSMTIEDEYFGPYSTTHQVKHEFDGTKYNVYERIYKKVEFDGVEGAEWEEWHPIIPTNIENGIAEGSIQSKMSSIGAKVFKFDLTHEYTEEDISKKKYYLTYVNQLMTQKPFSIVLGENYDFHGTITGMGSGSDGKWYVTVDNYIAPSKTDTRHMISESSYILLPYDNIEDGGDYVPFDHYTIDDETIFGNAHMMGDTPIGTGGASFGYKCYAQNIGTFSAGYMNISSGKYSGTLGRYNVTGYCDFAFGQDIKLFGHWQTGFGRDIFMAQNADYTFGGGRFNKSYGPCQFFAGEGHELYLPYANARGKYSITDSNKYVDKFGWGAAGARKNLYTLDANGNTWFAGEIRCGGSDYDAAARVAKTYSVSSLSALTSLDAKKGDMAIYMNTQQEHWCKLGADGENNGLAVFSGGTSSDAYTVDSEIGGRKCRKIPTQAEHPAKRANRFMYFAMEDLTATASEITFKIIYYDLGTELIQIQYNAADGAVTKPINVCYRTNTKRWKEATITISDAGFVHSTAIQKQDFRICGGNSGTGTDATYIAEMSVTTHKNTESGKNIHKDVYVLTDSKNTLQNWVQINT